MKKIFFAIFILALSLSALAAAGCGKKYTVTFDGAGGTLVSGEETQVVSSVYDIKYPIYEKVGYNFDGFTPENIETIDEDMVFTAKWTLKTFTVTFDYGGGSGDETSRTVTYGETVSNLPSAFRKHYEFKYWAKDGVRFEEDTEYLFNGSCTFIAVYEAVDYYELIFVNETEYEIANPAGETQQTVSVEYGETADVPDTTFESLSESEQNAAEVKFVGWYYLDKEGKERRFDKQTPCTEENFNTDALSITLYAKTSEDYYELTFINETMVQEAQEAASWADGSGNEPKTIMVKYGETVSVPKTNCDVNPDQNSTYMVIGWHYVDRSGNNVTLDATKPFTVENFDTDCWKITFYAEVTRIYIINY